MADVASPSRVIGGLSLTGWATVWSGLVSHGGEVVLWSFAQTHVEDANQFQFLTRNLATQMRYSADWKLVNLVEVRIDQRRAEFAVELLRGW